MLQWGFVLLLTKPDSALNLLYHEFFLVLRDLLANEGDFAKVSSVAQWLFAKGVDSLEKCLWIWL